MILLSGHSLTPARKVPVDAMGLSLKERESTATLTPADMTGIDVNSWFQDETEPGSGIVWRVRSIGNAYATRTPTLQLEHAINTLRDRALFGEIKPKDITGNPSATTCTAAQAVAYILNQQSDWVLGTFSYSSVSNPYQFNGDTLFDALETVTKSLDGAMWTYDMSAYPFTLNIVAKSDVVGSEMRASRNIRTITKTIDRTGMFTRFYPIGKNDLHIDSGYVEKNTALYGVVAKIATDASIDSKAELTRWANEQLDNHAEPIVTIEIDGFDLSQATGETLDRMQIGRVCRVPLPEFGTTIQERIVALSYSDKIGQPEVVKVTLANNREDVTRIIADSLKGAGKGARTSARQGAEDMAWFEDTDTHVAMVAKGIIGVDGSGNPNWERLSEFIVDGEGMHSKVTTALEGVQSQFSVIEQTESAIQTAVVANNSLIYSHTEQTASSIRTELASAESGLYTYVIQTASGMRQMIINRGRTWIQDTDPRTAGGGSHVPVDGDIWVESTHQGTWDGAEGFDWEHDEDYDWNQIQGAKVWGWKNNKWELISDQQQVVSYSDVQEAAEYWSRQMVKGIVNDQGMLDVYLARLQMEADSIRSDLYMAGSQIYTYINQTTSGIYGKVGERPTSVISTEEPEVIWYGDGPDDYRAPRDDDIWVESQFQDTWDEALAFNWDDDNQLDWNQLRSDKIHVYKDGAWHEAIDGTAFAEETELEWEKDHIKLVAQNLKKVEGDIEANRAEFLVEANRIRASVNEYAHSLGSTITQTAREIRAEVHAGESSIYSAITQTASSIRMEVANTTSGVYSSISQTASSIRSDVSAAKSSIYSFVIQTASNIVAAVKLRPEQVTSRTEPEMIGDREPVDDDIWIESQMQDSWDAALDFNWDDDYNIEWNKLRDDIIHVYRDGAWHDAVDGTILAEETDLDWTKDHLKIVSQNVKKVEDGLEANRAQFTVEANRIRSMVEERVAGIGSSITQTASEIRAEVHAANSQIYSSITQTASSIRMEVVNAISGVQASIETTASSIRADVSAANSTVYSYIEQTASYIRSEVGESESGIYSFIEQTASAIRAEVGTAKSGLYTAIEQTASAIRLEAVEAQSAVYAHITVTASTIRSEVGAAKSTIFSSIEQTASMIRMEVKNADSLIYSAIKQTASSITLSVAKTTSEIYASISITDSKIDSTVNAAQSTIYSSIEQTASSIRAEVGNVESDLYTAIEQTASAIRMEAETSSSEIYSYIEMTASAIRSEVGNSSSDMWTEITQTASAITQKVGKGEVISSINQTAEQITIQANRLNLDGYATMSMVQAAFQDVEQLSIEQLSIKPEEQGGHFTFGYYNVKWKNTTVKNVTLSGEWSFMTTAGTSVKGKLVSGYTDTTIYYLGR